MRLAPALLAFALICGAFWPAWASPFVDAATRLEGGWEGDNYVLRVDAQRAQASVDAARPFAWQRFLVKEVEGDRVTFAIGAELFEATIDADSLVLTSTSFRGERKLRRRHAPEEAP
jgi:hypothetical protein